MSRFPDEWRATWPPRAIALATAAYSVAVIVKPKVLAGPVGLTEADGSVPKPTASLIRSIGTRDVVLATALAVAPAGYPLRLLSAARVVADASDALWLGPLMRNRAALVKVAGTALGWAGVEALVGLNRRTTRTSRADRFSGQVRP
jgi:hypothetical protein